MVVFEARVNFTSDRWTRLLLFISHNPAFAHICLKTGKDALISHSLHPSPNRYQTNAPPPTPPRALCSDHRCAWLGLPAGLGDTLAVAFGDDKDTSKMETCALFYLHQAQNIAISKAEWQAASHSAFKNNILILKRGRFRNVRRERAASSRKHTL